MMNKLLLDNTTPPSLVGHRVLPKGYLPTCIDILCGRGKANTHWPGNLHFANVVQASLPRYKTAKRRVDKSIVVADTVSSLQDEGVKFIKLDDPTGRYVELTRDQVHEKTGHAIRDLLHKQRNGLVPRKSQSKTKMATQNNKTTINRSNARPSSTSQYPTPMKVGSSIALNAKEEQADELFSGPMADTLLEVLFDSPVTSAATTIPDDTTSVATPHSNPIDTLIEALSDAVPEETKSKSATEISCNAKPRYSAASLHAFTPLPFTSPEVAAHTISSMERSDLYKLYEILSEEDN